MARPTYRVPQRICIACRQAEGKRSLIRLVRTDGRAALDVTGKKAGRGAYVHPQASCWQKVAAGSLLQRALRTKISAKNLAELSDSVSELLQQTDETAG